MDDSEYDSDSQNQEKNKMAFVKVHDPTSRLRVADKERNAVVTFEGSPNGIRLSVELAGTKAEVYYSDHLQNGDTQIFENGIMRQVRAFCLDIEEIYCPSIYAANKDEFIAIIKDAATAMWGTVNHFHRPVMVDFENAKWTFGK
jgi:hypothetical protein